MPCILKRDNRYTQLTWFSQGFEVNENVPLFVFMGRLDAQKGVDIMFESIDAGLKSGLNAQVSFTLILLPMCNLECNSSKQLRHACFLA